jgi:hypothetical protein
MGMWKHLFLILAFFHSIYFDVSRELHLLLLRLLFIRISVSETCTTSLTYFSCLPAQIETR